MEERRNERPNIVVHGNYYDIHNNTYIGGSHSYGGVVGENHEEAIPLVQEYEHCNDADKQELEEEKIDVLPQISRMSIILKAVNQMYLNGVLTQKSDCAAVYRIIEEKKIYEKFQFSDFEKMMEKSELPDNLKPNSDNIRKITFRKCVYPNWRIVDKDAIYTEHMVEIGKAFLDLTGF